jgi:hypothetical protein
MIVIESEMGAQSIEVPSRMFTHVFCKRSRLTPARAHPKAEQEEFDNPKAADETKTKQHSLADQSANAEAIANLSEEERDIYLRLSNQPVHFDKLFALTGMSAGTLASNLMLLELAGLVERQSGDRYVLAGTNRIDEVSPDLSGLPGDPGHRTVMMVADSAKFIKYTFGGISRKYLQFYLAAYWCYRDRVRWHKRSLFRACLRFPPIRSEQMMAYVSPGLVRILPSH